MSDGGVESHKLGLCHHLAVTLSSSPGLILPPPVWREEEDEGFKDLS